MDTRVYRVNQDDYLRIEDMVTNLIASPIYLESDNHKNVMIEHDMLTIEIKGSELEINNVDAFLMTKPIVLVNSFDCIDVLAYSENTGRHYVLFRIESE